MNVSTADYGEIYAMYQDFCKSQKPESIASDFCTIIVKNLEKNGPESLSDLKVELPIAKIKEIYKKYHVIQLRDIRSSQNLLLGCGNSPLTDQICKGEGHHHTHEDFVTIDPDIYKNPTVIGAFGTQESLHEFLPKKFYVKLVTELSSVANNTNEICENTFACMREDFKCYRMDSKAELTEEKDIQSSHLFNCNSWLY